MFCSDIIKTTWLIFSSETPPLLYYSHIPTAFIAILLGFFVLLNNKRGVSNKIFFLLNLAYGFLIFLNLILWTNSYIPAISVIWPITQVFFVIVPVLAIYFFYTFINKKDVSLFVKTTWSIVIVILGILASSKFNFVSFNNILCEPILTNTLFFYQNIIFVIVFIFLIISFIKNILQKNTPRDERKESVLLFFGILLFLFSFTITWQFAETYEYFNLEQYGLFGMTLLLAIVSFIIVRFKAFDIKLIGAQALVWSMIVLVGSQFFYLSDMPITSIILTSITLLISAIVGLMIVRGVKREITLREHLEIANRNQESLIHFVSHQLKGFFTKSKMIFSGIVEDDFGQASKELKDAAKEGLLSDDNAVSMIQDILGASNLKNGTTVYNLKEVDFADIVRKTCEGFKKEIEDRGLGFINNIPNTSVKVLADLTQITQVVKNLIDNSLKYTPKGSVEVSLSSEKKDGKDKVLLVIKDTGIGLSESDKKKLFTEGGKGDESLKVNVNSTGYGLYIVKKIVENHGGKIWAESDGRGMGSRFCVELGMIK